MNGESQTITRISDFSGVIPAITGKIELVYEGEQEGPAHVAQHLLEKAVRKIFIQHFPDPSKFKKHQKDSPYKAIIQWFEEGNVLDIPFDSNDIAYQTQLLSVPTLKEMTIKKLPADQKKYMYTWMELVLHGMAAHSLISKFPLASTIKFGDITSGMLQFNTDLDDSDDEADQAFKDLFN
jgi:magnesium chelatase subunit I